MIDRLNGSYKDTSDSEQAAAICIGGMVAILAIGGIVLLIMAAVELLG